MREDYAFKVSCLGVPACAGDVVNASLVLAAQTIRESPRSLRTACYDRFRS